MQKGLLHKGGSTVPHWFIFKVVTDWYDELIWQAIVVNVRNYWRCKNVWVHADITTYLHEIIPI